MIFSRSAVIAVIVSRASAFYGFAPETTTQYLDPRLPALYDPAISQTTAYNSSNSYWTCSFVTASNGHQYVIVNHVMTVNDVPVKYFRASILDATTDDYHMYLADEPSESSTDTDGLLDAVTSRNGIEGVSNDSLSVMRTWSVDTDITFDLVFEATSRLVLNGGLGEFTYGGAASGEWGLPRARTNGTITVNGLVLEVDPKASFTWYDRQWGGGAMEGNYTWFLAQFPDAGIASSIWAIDDHSRGIATRFATFRFSNGSNVVLPYTLVASAQEQFYSNVTGHSYPTKYQLLFDGGDWIDVLSVKKDQLISNSSSSASPGTEAFSTMTYCLFGRRGRGYGIIEQVWLG